MQNPPTLRITEDERAAFTHPPHILLPPSTPRCASLGVIHIKTSGLFPTHQHSLTAPPVIANAVKQSPKQPIDLVFRRLLK
ncbi:MAG: hypothetical protein LBT83_11515 [Tannerella sp.]|nr:hypothetical protein [Tannerella sp.]